jgi:hypothetical protein
LRATPNVLAITLRGIARSLRPGALRCLAIGSAAAFGLFGVLTNLCCGTVILAYRRAAEIRIEPTDDPQSVEPRDVVDEESPCDPLLALYAVSAGAVMTFLFLGVGGVVLDLGESTPGEDVEAEVAASFGG